MNAKLSVLGGVALGAAAAFGAGKIMPDGSTRRLVGFACHVEQRECQAEIAVTDPTGVPSTKMVRFTFGGKIKNEQGQEIQGTVPPKLAACVQSFRNGELDGAADIK